MQDIFLIIIQKFYNKKEILIKNIKNIKILIPL